MGIAASVRTKWAIQLIIIILLVIVGVKVVQTISRKYNKSFYNVSFNEGASLNMLEIHSNEKIDLIEKDKNLKVSIKMTLTTPNCPVAGEMPSMVARAVEELQGFKSIEVELVWDPPWNKEMMSEDAKLALDIT